MDSQLQVDKTRKRRKLNQQSKEMNSSCLQRVLRSTTSVDSMRTVATRNASSIILSGREEFAFLLLQESVLTMLAEVSISTGLMQQRSQSHPNRQTSSTINPSKEPKLVHLRNQLEKSQTQPKKRSQKLFPNSLLLTCRRSCNKKNLSLKITNLNLSNRRESSSKIIDK